MATKTQTVKDYLQRFEQLRDRRDPWEPGWKEATEHANPRRELWDDDERTNNSERGKKVGTKSFDSRPRRDAGILKNGLIGYNCNPSSPWWKARIAFEELNEIPYVKDWLEICEKIVYSALHKFGFYEAADEAIQDEITVGHLTMMVDEDVYNQRINYSTRHPKETWISRGPDGRVNRVYRKLMLTNENAAKMFGKKNLPQNIANQIDDEPFKENAYLHILEQREDVLPGVSTSDNMPIASVVMAIKDEEIVRESGFLEMPAIVAMWSKNSDEWYARSPTTDAIAELKKGSEIFMNLLLSGQLNILKPLNIPERLRGKEQIIPFGFNYYKNPSEIVSPIDLKSAYPVGKDILEIVHQAIDDLYYTDLFLMLQQAGREMTAREVIERQGEKVALLAGPLTRLNTQFLTPVLQRTWSIAARAGWLPPPPPMLVQAYMQRLQFSPGRKSDNPIQIEFVGLLAQVQKRYQEMHGVNSELAIIDALGQRKPDVWDNFDLDDLARKIASNSFPQSSIVEIPQRDKARKARAAEMQRQQKLVEAAEQAKMLPALNEAPEPGSPAEAVTQQAGMG